MKNYSKNKQFSKLSLVTVLTLSCFFITLFLWNQNIVVNPIIEEDANQTKEKIDIKTATDYSALAEVHIKDNWTLTASTYAWCSGSGSEADPYVIDGLVIDGGKTNICLVIQDTLENFTIKNCEFYNSLKGMDGGGLVLENVTNGNITKNKIYDNYYGIWLNDTSNMLIEDNQINRNKKDGIILQKSEKIHIFDNLIKNSTENGIFLVDSSNNNMSYNIIHINTLYGVHLDENSANNGLRENYLGYNAKGCILDEGTANIFYLNDCIGNYEEEPNYADYEPTDLTPIIIGVVIAIIIVVGLILFAKFGYPVIKKFLEKSGESREKELEKQV